MVILGLNYCSISRVCNLDPAMVTKYSGRIDELLRAGRSTSKDLKRVIGNLQFAAWVEPFGRPLLSLIALLISPNKPPRVVRLPAMARVALRVWLLLLRRNRGMTLKYILNDLPVEKRRIYVDAALSRALGDTRSTPISRFP